MISCESVGKYKEHEKPSKLKFVKMMILEDLQAKTIQAKVKENIAPSATIKTDGFKFYNHLSQIVAQY